MVELDNRLPFDGQVFLDRHFLNDELSFELLEKVTVAVNWQSRKIKMFGKFVLQPRLMCWMGDADASYKYSGIVFEPTPWSSAVLEIKRKVEDRCNCHFNSVLLNLYRNNRDSMGLHSDNEKELGKNPIIASVSLGAKRKFVFRHKARKQKVELELGSGSLLLMKGRTQTYWKHELPKAKHLTGPRVNLTFRKIDHLS